MERRRFLADETGAVSIDFVPLTAVIVGLGVATAGVVSGGIGGLSNSIVSFLNSDAWDLYSNGSLSLASGDFAAGDAAGWVGGAVTDMAGELGELLVLGPGESTSFTFAVPAGADSATVSFDLIAGDSLDNSAKWGTDTATITLNGVTVATATPGGQGATFDIPQGDGTTVTASVTTPKSSLGGKSHWKDAVTTVSITTTSPGSAVTVGVTSNANQSIGDEFWGVDNFSASSTGAPGF